MGGVDENGVKSHPFIVKLRKKFKKITSMI